MYSIERELTSLKEKYDQAARYINYLQFNKLFIFI